MPALAPGPRIASRTVRCATAAHRPGASVRSARDGAERRVGHDCDGPLPRGRYLHHHLNPEDFYCDERVALITPRWRRCPGRYLRALTRRRLPLFARYLSSWT